MGNERKEEKNVPDPAKSSFTSTYSFHCKKMERLLQKKSPICARFFTKVVARRSQGTLGGV